MPASTRSCSRSELAVVVGLAIAAAWAWWWRIDTSALPEVTRFRDDAYYYFAWARSVAAGDGPCVTRGVPTSGLQPMWGWWLAAAARLFGADSLPVFAQLSGLMFHVGAAGVLFVALRATPFAALCAALLYVGNPFLLTEAQNGQDTGMACFAIAVVAVLTHARWRWFALSAVVAVLARADLLFCVAALSIVRTGVDWRVVVAPALALASSMLVNVLLAGSPWSDAAAPIPWLFNAHFDAGNPSTGDVLRRWWWYLRPCLLGGPFATVSPITAGALVAVVVGPWLPARWRFAPLLLTAIGVAAGADDYTVPGVAALLLLAPGVGRARSSRAGALLIGCAAIVVAHELVRHYPRDYYFAPFGVAGVWAVARLQAVRPVLGVATVLAVAGHAVFAASSPAPRRAWQEEMAIAGRFVSRVVGTSPVGCFNSGLVTWLRTDGDTVNLDGLANRPAFDALRRADLNGYLDRREVCWLLDTEVQFAREADWPHASGRHFGPQFEPARDLLEMARFDVPGVDGGRAGTDGFRLYWRRTCGAPPEIPVTARDLGPAPGGLARYVFWPAIAGGGLRVAPASSLDRARLVVRADAAVLFVLRVDLPEPGRYVLLNDAGEVLLTFDS